MENNDKKIAVIGMGYVGIPAAVLLADAGYDVTGIQRRSKRSGWKIDWLNEGKCPIGGNEPELPQILDRVVRLGKFRVTDDYAALKDIDIILIDVQTPTDENHIPRYESLKEVCHHIGKFLHPGGIVIIESTVAPGTTEYLVKPILEEESGLKAGLPEGFGLCFSYERVMVGRLIHNIREYPKIVGGIDAESTRVAVMMYQSVVRGGVYGTDPMTAEVSKTVENAYRDVQIAFSNEVALLCETLGIDVYDVRKFVNGLPYDPSSPHANPVRNMHFPGAGVGGHCLPKDTWLLMHGYERVSELPSQKYSYPASVLKDARFLNDWMPVHMVDLLESAFSFQESSLEKAALPAAAILTENSPRLRRGDNGGGNNKQSLLAGRTICVLGFAFLENSDDPRNTPTIPVLKELERRGAYYKIHDPFVTENEGYIIEPDLDSALKDCDAVLLMTKHEVYNSVTPEKLNGCLKNKIIVDGRNLFNAEKFINAGFIFKGIGKGNINKLTIE